MTIKDKAYYDRLYDNEPWAKLAREAGHEHPSDVESSARNAFLHCADRIAELEAERDRLLRPVGEPKVMAELAAMLAKARAKHAPMNSPHEGWSVIYEELEELREHVRADTGRGPEARKEALQVAAMGLRYVLDLCTARPPVSLPELLNWNEAHRKAEARVKVWGVAYDDDGGLTVRTFDTEAERDADVVAYIRAACDMGDDWRPTMDEAMKEWDFERDRPGGCIDSFTTFEH
jgi:hypothetical protein